MTAALPLVARAPAGRLLGLRYHLVSLGCPKNTVNSSFMEGILERDGMRPTFEAGEADVVLVNTCGFLQSAAQESIDTLLSLAELKHEHPGMKLLAVGCLAQRYADEMYAEMPELDGVVGTHDWPQLSAVVAECLDGRRVLRARTLTPVQYAELPFRVTGIASTFIKIADGCNFRCSFCTIPAFTGDLKSKAPAEVLSEVRQAVAAGTLEVVLVAQNLTGYGRDLRPRTTLAALLHEIAALDPPPPWVRLMYANLEGVSEELIDAMATLPMVVPYLEMPLQHVHPGILKRMQRAYTPAHIHQRVARLRERLPDIALRTTFIVGFPGEGKEEFALLLRTMEELEFDWAVGFTYSAEEGSAAAQFEPRVPFREQRARLKELLILQREISARRNARWVGRELDVLVERVQGKGPLRAAGRSFRDAPEIDGTVIVRADQPPPLDRFLRVRIEASDAYALRGVPVDAVPA